MKQRCQSFICAISLVLFAVSLSAANRQLFSLSLATPKRPLKAGTELRLLVNVTNTSSRTISFITSPGEVPEDGLLYEINVRDEHNHSAPPSAYLRTMDKRVSTFGGSFTAHALKPGESFVDEVTVTLFYELSRPGKYTISVSRPFPPRQNLGKGKVTSNTITVTVVQ